MFFLGRGDRVKFYFIESLKVLLNVIDKLPPPIVKSLVHSVYIDYEFNIC